MAISNSSGMGYNPYDYVLNAQTRNPNQQNSNNYPSSNYSRNNTLTQKDYNALVDCYSATPSESLLGAAWGGVTFGLMNNPRFVAHPINTFKAFSGVKEMFNPVLQEGHLLNKLWTDPKTNSIMRDAYSEMHRAFARNERRLPIFRTRYSDETLKTLKREMERALKSGDPQKIAEATEILRGTYVTDTKFGKLFRPLLKVAGVGSPYKTQEEALKNRNSEYIKNKTAERLEKAGKLSFKDAMKAHAGVGGIAFFALIEFLMGMGNIKKAYAKDKENKQNGVSTNYGGKQLFQTTIKGIGSGVGWGLGEAASIWAYGKWGAKLGAKGHPAIGSIIGGVIGLVGGSIGMMLTGRLTKAAVGEDVGATIAARELMETPEGQAQVLEDVYDKAKKGKANPAAKAALKKVIEQLQSQQAQIQFQPNDMRQAVRTSNRA